ncbi:OLC1v1023785C1 [Oldenlandia corymbosa var. corymbosa]|uniref:OLC1v1023785C1 n=1 Tax=Oldenlandia corymbosa var. corymbosa TaxID=529605 RepID=A0AAV1C3T6_OLDCO|nr:OLC1v1023785C1 [Oldenlandia corymbosa var. corymbosa]
MNGNLRSSMSPIGGSHNCSFKSQQWRHRYHSSNPSLKKQQPALSIPSIAPEKYNAIWITSRGDATNNHNLDDKWSPNNCNNLEIRQSSNSDNRSSRLPKRELAQENGHAVKETSLGGSEAVGKPNNSHLGLKNPPMMESAQEHHIRTELSSKLWLKPQVLQRKTTSIFKKNGSPRYEGKHRIGSKEILVSTRKNKSAEDKEIGGKKRKRLRDFQDDHLLNAWHKAKKFLTNNTGIHRQL